MNVSLIVSNDSITMKPPYEITSSILKLITSISEKIGEVNANLLNKPSQKLRKQNRIKTSFLTKNRRKHTHRKTNNSNS